MHCQIFGAYQDAMKEDARFAISHRSSLQRLTLVFLTRVKCVALQKRRGEKNCPA